MNKMLTLAVLCCTLLFTAGKTFSQVLPGDSLVFGPMFSVVYHDSVRVWVMTKDGTGSGNALSLELRPTGGGPAVAGTPYNTDTRLGFNLRSFLYTNLAPGQDYTARVLANGSATLRSAHVKNAASIIGNFAFLAGGCGRIYDTTRCIDRPESFTHTNGTPDIYKHMATENADMMVWTGDATYLLGLEHTMGVPCPGAVDDWNNRDALFARYGFYRKFQDSLIRAMPQLAIPDNHDLGGNEFNKTMPTLAIAKENFKNWWPNPVYSQNSDGPGLYSSYRYKDVEFFLLDNRSYRESTTRHLGVYQLAWLKQALLQSTATFKVLISGTPAFNKGWGGRNFSITQECDTLLRFIKANNINGVLCYSADIHGQQFYGKYNDHTYPFFDVLSGNLASDVDLTAATSITPNEDAMFWSNAQTYLRTNVYGTPGDRRYKIDYVSPQGVLYYSAILHEDMLKSVDDSTLKVSLAFSNGLSDSSAYARPLSGSGIAYVMDKDSNALSAACFDGTAAASIPFAPELSMQDRTFSISYWARPEQFAASGYSAVFSNSSGNNGFSLGFDYLGHPLFVHHGNGNSYAATVKVPAHQWSHITWKYDNVKLQLSLYLSGQLVQKWTGVATPAVSAGALRLGNNADNKPFTGTLDAFRIYGKLITDKTVQQLSGYTPHRGSAINLAGSQNMFIPAAQVNPVFAAPFSVDFWARFTSASIVGPLLSTHGRINNQTTGWDIEISNNKACLVFGNNSTSGWLKINEAGYAWRSGEWNHVAFTAIPGDSLYFYINGEKVGSAKYTAYYANNFNLGLGKSSSYGSTAQIEMDELHIWNQAQSKADFVKRMHYKLQGNESGLAFYYDFEPNTDTTIKSKGSNAYELTLNNAALIASLAPVTAIDSSYRSMVAGNWSIKKAGNKGLTLTDAIPTLSSSLISGHLNDSLTAAIQPGSAIRYLKGGWQLDGLNLPVANLKLNLDECLTGYDTLAREASEYYLLRKAGSSWEIVNTGYFDGTALTFTNTFVDTGVYYLGWKSDTSAALFDRGGALSLLSGHNVTVPSAAVNSALSGNGLTIELWARLMQDPSANAKLMGKSSSGGGNQGFEFEFQDNNAVQAIFGTPAGAWNTISSTLPWNIGEWNHVALTAAPNDTLKLYLNGMLVGKKPFGSYNPNNYDLAFGRNLFNQNPITGMMDEVRIWSKVKSQAEILNQMHLSLPAGTDTALKFNYTFNHNDNGRIINYGATIDSVAKTNAKIIPATAPVGNIYAAQQYRVTGDWSLRDTTNGGLSVLVALPDYEANLVIGRDSLHGNDSLTGVPYGVKLRQLWQLDPLKVETGVFDFDGQGTFSTDWPSIRNAALEFYLLKRDTAGQMQVQAVGTQNNDRVRFNSVQLAPGLYTLGWLTDDGIILPVTWGNVWAYYKDAYTNMVAWETVQEKNTSHFEIERSENARDFREIGRVAAAGESNRLLHYFFADEQLKPGVPVYYYRIRQTDIDGRYHYAPVVKVLRREASVNFEVLVSPNPGKSAQMAVSINGDQQEYKLALIDAGGAMIWNTAATLGAVPRRVLPALPGGTYFLSVQGNGLSATRKIVVR